MYVLVGEINWGAATPTRRNGGVRNLLTQTGDTVLHPHWSN